MTLSYSYYIDTLTDSAYIIFGKFEKKANKMNNIYNLIELESIWNLVDDKINQITENTEITELPDNFRNNFETFEKAYHSLIFTIFFSSKYYELIFEELYYTCKKLREKIKFTGDINIYNHLNENKLRIKFFHHNGIIEGKLYHSYYGHYIEEIEFCNGIKHGSYKKYDNNGKLIGAYNYENNIIDGLYLDEYNSTKIKCIYKNGIKNGEMIMYNNKIYVKTYYVNDMEHGIHLEYTMPSRKLRAQCEYKNNMKNGNLIIFYNDTKLIQSYVDDKLHGFVFTYKKIDGKYMLANKIEYKYGKRDGIETIYIIDSNDENDENNENDENVENLDAYDNFNTNNYDDYIFETETESEMDAKILIEKYYKDDVKYKEINFMDNSKSTFTPLKI